MSYSDDSWLKTYDSWKLASPPCDDAPTCAECGEFLDVGTHEDCRGEPYVCPGCHAVDEPCAPGCIDAEIERKRQEAQLSGDYRCDKDDSDDIGF